MIMQISRLSEILNRIKGVRIAVVGDFFLDKYLIIDPSLHELSLETGLETRQVIEVRCQPGAAGTVSANLTAIGVGKIFAITVIGDDGEGYELKKGMAGLGLDMKYCVETPDRYTPTYTKPLIQKAGSPVELQRLDIRNRTGTPPQIEDKLIANIDECLLEIDAVLIMDQVTEHNCGTVTDRVRQRLNRLAASSEKIFYADSRKCISRFRNMIVKCNNHELLKALEQLGLPSKNVTLEQAARAFRDRTHQPVYVTMGEKGMMLLEENNAVHIPAFKVDGPVDIVGAGDSASSAIVSSLCAGASPEEAGIIGNLASSITIRKLGTTGTASTEELIDRLENYRDAP